MARKGNLTPTQCATVAFCQHLVQAPEEHIQAESPECLLELIQVGIKHLEEILPRVGCGWTLVELEILKSKTEKRLKSS